MQSKRLHLVPRCGVFTGGIFRDPKFVMAEIILADGVCATDVVNGIDRGYCHAVPATDGEEGSTSRPTPSTPAPPLPSSYKGKGNVTVLRRP